MGAIRNRGTKAAPAWYIRYRDADGKWKERNSKQPTKADAGEVLASAEARVRRGEAGLTEPTPEERGRKSVTVGDLTRRFLGDVDGEPGYRPPRIKSLDNYRRDARSVLKGRIGPALGTRAAIMVKAVDVERMRDRQLSDGLAPASVLHTLATLSKLYNWARKAGLVDCANPVQGVERPRPMPSLDYLSAAEVGRLLEGVEDMARPGVASWQTLTLWPMVATAIYCGLRKGELFGLRWADVHLDVARLDVWRSYLLLPKSGKPRHVPMHEDLTRILRGWRKLCPASPEALVFPVEARGGGFHIATKFHVLGIADLFTATGCHSPADGHPWHMLRHTFAAHAVMSGASLYAVQRLLGHESAAMTQRYAHLAPDFMAAEVARMHFPRPSSGGVTDISEGRRRKATPPDADP